MNSESNRFYRKNLITNGLCYINGKELEVSIVNMSITGVLVQLSYESLYSSDVDNTSNNALVSTVIDFYLPQLRLAGTAEVIRMTQKEDYIWLALKFKDISYNVENLLYKRKVYRKNMSVAGKILLNDEYHDFHTVNVSVEGLMIRLVGTVNVTEGLTTTLEFNNTSFKGKVEAVWTETDEEGNTLIGLKYIHMNAREIKGIPRFFTTND